MTELTFILVWIVNIMSAEKKSSVHTCRGLGWSEQYHCQLSTQSFIHTSLTSRLPTITITTSTTTFSFCLTGLFSGDHLVRPGPPHLCQTRTYGDCWCTIFHRPDALPVTQPTVSKHCLAAVAACFGFCLPAYFPEIITVG